MATIKDIARAAGVSQGTVSNVLNGKGNVSSTKIRQVQQAAQQLGYALNQRAQVLRSDCLWAFCVGGGICLLGEVLRGWYLGMGLEAELAGTLTSCTLIVLSALLTTLGLYQKLAAKAGAGSLVPITGFANAVVSAAIEFKPEGRVCGTGAKMFTIAGPVIVYGTLAAVVYGGVLWLLGG